MNIDIIKNNIDEILKYKTPVYVYLYDVLKDRCLKMKTFKDNLEKEINKKVTIHYSTKANNNPQIIKVVKESGLKVDAMSPLELDIDLKCGFKNDEIIYVCNNIDKEEMKLIRENNILPCFDSISQVKMWGNLFKNTNIMIRINPGIKGVGHNEKVITSGKKTKFGISEENIKELKEVAEKYQLNIIGTHLHLGSLFLNDSIDKYIKGVKEYLKIVKNNFENIKIIDLGGGFGVPYQDEEPLDFNLLIEKLKKILIKFNKEYEYVEEYKFEPGRFIPCESGLIIGKVNSIKSVMGKNYIGTDIGMNILVRPSMYDAYHKVSIINKKEKKEKIIANITGNICESGDVLARDRNISKPEIDDIVIVENSGAYGFSMSSNYTGRPRPAEIMIKNGKIEEIRKRDTLEYLEKNLIF